MKFGVREICDVVLKAKAPVKIGNKVFYKNEPVIYFDSLKTSSMEGAATTVYAQGGRGNSRLVAWEGERTVTFTMEDALISPEGFMILSGAGLVEADGAKNTYVYQHVVETTDDVVIANDAVVAAMTDSGMDVRNGDVIIYLKHPAYLPTDKNDNFAYVMLTIDGAPASEPIIPVHTGDTVIEPNAEGKYPIVIKKEIAEGYWVKCADQSTQNYAHSETFMAGAPVLVDYYVKRASGAKQIEITAEKFGGNYYLEASTLFRDTNGVDMPAEFIIPNCKIQSNFTFTMASSGDPSTFTFTMDAFPDYTRFDKTKKVLAAIQIIEDSSEMGEIARCRTPHESAHDNHFID